MARILPIAAALGLLVACDNADPSEELTQTVGYRSGVGATTSGERGNIKISEVLWSGSVSNDGTYDREDVFVELKNEGALPVNVENWILEISGALNLEWRIPAGNTVIAVGDRIVVAHKSSGCFPDVDVVMPELRFPTGDSFRLTLSDSDERLIEPIGSRTMPPFAGGYDLVRSRSMERIEMMFGGNGSEPQAWHYYTPLLDDDQDVENNDLVAISCREGTLASPGRANSPDYSGAFAAGNLE
ncbi:MAG TPA: hypothetical protein DFR83_21365 [Deltaproteobacteria bacterium]|mgnify:CR=1 FL=1|nr:hypothetical protein [Deltaproteobacteria bacterium]